MAALTLVGHLKLVKNDLEEGVLKDLLRNFDLFSVLPIKSMPGLRVRGTRFQTLPTISTRKLNGTYSTTTGATEQTEETVYIYGAEYQVDRILMMDKTTIEDPLTVQRNMHVISTGYKVATDFINGDHASSPDGFEGLKKRVANAPSRMTVDLASSGDSLKVLASAATEHSFIDALHKADKYVGGASAFFMNEATLLGVGQVLRRASVLATTKDQFDREFMTFKGAKLVDIGLQADQSTEIITSTEDPGDAGNDATSIYAVRFDGEDGFHAIQLSGTSPTPYSVSAELETAPAVKERIDWALGLRNKGRYAVARISGFKMAAA